MPYQKITALTDIVYGMGRLWPDDQNPRYFFLSSREKSKVTEVSLVAPAHYAVYLERLCLAVRFHQLSWVWLMENELEADSTVRDSLVYHLHGTSDLLRYHTDALHAVIAEIVDELGDLSEVALTALPQPDHEIHLPTLDEWVRREVLNLQCPEPAEIRAAQKKPAFVQDVISNPKTFGELFFNSANKDMRSEYERVNRYLRKPIASAHTGRRGQGRLVRGTVQPH